MLRFRVETLGTLAVFGAKGASLPIAGSCRPILGYLLTHRHRRVSRTELAETLWADHDDSRARRCLSTALWRLKKTTGAGPSLLAFNSAEEASLNLSRAWVDAIAMEWRVAPLLRHEPATLTRDQIARLHRGVRLYRGDYLSGIDHEWAWIERQRLRNLYLDGLYHLTLAYAANSDWPRVLEWGRRLSMDEPLREDVHRLLMRAHASAGNRALAIAQYQLCQRVLKSDLDVEPMPETQALYQVLASEPATAGEPPPLVEPPAITQARRRVSRVRRLLAASQRQLDQVLQHLAPIPTPKTDI